MIFETERKKRTPGRVVLHILMVLSLAVWICYLGGALILAFTGFSMMFHRSYGMDALLGFLAAVGLIIWPLLVICGVILIVGLIYFRKTR